MMHYWTTITMVVVTLLALAIFVAWLSTKSTRKAHPVVAKPVLTAAELAFHGRLVRAVNRISPRLMTFSQVSMAAIIDTERGLDDKTRFATRSLFNRKIVDFVVTDHRTNVLLVIELDDWSHDNAGERDRARDQITASAGYPTLRIRGKEARDDRAIEAYIRQHVVT